MTKYSEEKQNTRKTKRNRRETDCTVKIRGGGYNHHCGTCGSENVAKQGVVYCEKCGRETPYLLGPGEGNIFSWNVVPNTSKDNKPCKCVKIVERKQGKFIKKYKTTYLRSIGVTVCMDCGSVMSNFCPNCTDTKTSWLSNRCWKSPDGKVHCQKCGYKISKSKFI